MISCCNFDWMRMFGNVGKTRLSNSYALIATLFLLIGCQSLPKVQPNPLAHLPENVKDAELAEFVENHILVVQTCLPDKKINLGTQDVEIDNLLPLTVCQSRQSLGRSCPKNWLSSEPSDTKLPFEDVRKVRIWSASDDPQNIEERWIPSGTVIRSPIVNSAGSFVSYLRDTTALNQPVFEYTVDEPRYLFAWSVSVQRDYGKKKTTFWYQPPQNLQLNKFSPWSRADSEESPQNLQSVKMANNSDFLKNQLKADSPLVRFGLFTTRQYSDSLRLYNHVYKQAQPQVKVKGGYKSNEVFQVLRMGSSEIPACE